MKQELDCYIDYLLSEAKTLTPEQISMLIWETIIETADTTLVTTEWAMYELAKYQKQQVISVADFHILYVQLVSFSW